MKADALRFFAVAGLLALAPAWAQGLVDPTRPPSASPGAPQDDAPAGAPQLQSVLISPGRRLAIISGNTVALGDAVGDAKVVKITETEVVLRRGDETEVLKLFPGVDKQPVKRGSGRAQKSSQQGRSQ
jgi:MSHA biogenesis protein MshK